MTGAGGGDVRGASPRNLWSALSLSKINAMLSQPLTEEEVKFNQVCTWSASSTLLRTELAEGWLECNQDDWN